MENLNTGLPVSATENNESIINDALEIAHELNASQHDLLMKIREIAATNSNFNNSYTKYGGIEMFYSFQFQCFDTAAVGLGQSYLFGLDEEGLERYIKANKKSMSSVSIDRLNEIKKNFEERKVLIIERLSKNFADEKEAFNEIQAVHKELVMPVLNTEKVF